MTKPSEIFTDEMLARYKKYLDAGDIDGAVNLFKSSLSMAEFKQFERTARRFYQQALDREMRAAEIQALSTELTMATNSLARTVSTQMRSFTTNVIGDYYFKATGLSNARQQSAIVESALAQFEYYTNGALSNTPAHILNDIRQIQKDWIFHNYDIRNMSNVDGQLDRTEKQFRQMLRKKYKTIYQDIEDGKIIKSRGTKNIRAFTLDEYVEVSVRPTILNVDRNTVEMSAHLEDLPVVEYYLRDTRHLKTEERDVCAEILKKKVHGKSLLALTAETARQLGIMTLQAAKDKGAMFIHCRHSIRKPDAEYIEQLKKVIFVSELAVS